MKTKEEQLKIYSAYLPYGLQVIKKSEEKPETLKSVKVHWHKNTLTTEFNEYYLEDIKPVLYPLDMLTKEIEHNGKKFIPIERIRLCTDASHFKYIERFIYDEETISLLPWWVIELLLEWHFNVFNLDESEYINKATLKTQ